jgi:hypothetical protein
LVMEKSCGESLVSVLPNKGLAALSSVKSPSVSTYKTLGKSFTLKAILRCVL